MNLASLSQLDVLVTRISLRNKIYLLLVTIVLAMLLKLVLDTNQVLGQLQSSSAIQMIDYAKDFDVQAPYLAEQSRLDLKQLVQKLPGYQSLIIEKGATLPEGSEIAQLPSVTKEVVDMDGQLILRWPLADGSELVVSQSDEPIRDASRAFIWSSLIETLIIVAILVLFLFMTTRIVIKQVDRLKMRLDQMAHKDFSPVEPMAGDDEFCQIDQAIEKTRVELAQVFEVQLQSTESLLDMAEQVNVCMEVTKEATSEEFSQVEHLATAMTQMVATVNEIAGNAESTSGATEQASSLAESGNQDVMQTIETINLLANDIELSSKAVTQVEERVHNIGSVVETIKSISEQTNLLALNAAIEAARAGEYGRGFAVVADEVRNLAQRTQQATVEIHAMIEQLQKCAEDAGQLMTSSVEQAHQGVSQVGSAGDGLNKIVAHMREISEMNYHIATSAEEQTSVASEMNDNLEQVKELIEGSVIVIDEIAESADIISSHGQTLSKISKAFKIDADIEETEADDTNLDK